MIGERMKIPTKSQLVCKDFLSDYLKKIKISCAIIDATNDKQITFHNKSENVTRDKESTDQEKQTLILHCKHEGTLQP